jgi:hypothetical protein
MGVDPVQGFAIAPSTNPVVIFAATSAADFIRDSEILALIGSNHGAQMMDDVSLQSLHKHPWWTIKAQRREMSIIAMCREDRTILALRYAFVSRDRNEKN